MINSIQIDEATVREVRTINQVLILSLLNTEESGKNNYFQAKCYGESSSLNIAPGARLSLDGKIAFDVNRKAYVAINFSIQVKVAAMQPSVKTALVTGEVVKNNSVQPFGLPRAKSTVVQKGEVVLKEAEQKVIQSKKEHYENWESGQYDEEHSENLDHSQYDTDPVPSDWDEIPF